MGAGIDGTSGEESFAQIEPSVLTETFSQEGAARRKWAITCQICI
jgi:hypothetical protein